MEYSHFQIHLSFYDRVLCSRKNVAMISQMVQELFLYANYVEGLLYLSYNRIQRRRNCIGVNFLQILGGGAHSPFLSPPLPCPALLSSSSPFPSPLLLSLSLPSSLVSP